MQVKDLKLGRLISVEPTTPLSDIARRMRVDDADSVAVMSRGRLVGIVTERDLVRAMADAIDPQEATAQVVMSEDPATVGPEDDVSMVAVKMMRLGVRHFPVVGEDGKPVGLLSARDLVRGLDRD